MKITPQEFIEVQRKAARDAVASVTEVKGLTPIECGVRGHVWIDEARDSVAGSVKLNLAGNVSQFNFECAMTEIVEDENAVFQHVQIGMRKHIECEVEAVFDAFASLLARRLIQARAKAVKP